MKDGIHVFWLRDGKHPVSCVASKLEEGKLTFAVATHNPHDKFNRATGRNKAVGRLKASLDVHPETGELHHKTIALSATDNPRVRLLQAIMSEPKFGIRAMTAAQVSLAGMNHTA